MASEVDRRAMLTGVGLGALGLVAASGCSSSTAGTAAPDGYGGDSLPPGSDPTIPATSDPATSDPTTPAATRQPPQQQPAGPSVVALAHLSPGQTVSLKDPTGRTLLVTRTGAQSVVAWDATCTHQGCTVAASGLCPCHGSRFQPATGQVVNGPAARPLAKVAVAVSNGQVVLST
jgi:Rieske Fe-S protein